jgi:hypothetical protein
MGGEGDYWVKKKFKKHVGTNKALERAAPQRHREHRDGVRKNCTPVRLLRCGCDLDGYENEGWIFLEQLYTKSRGFVKQMGKILR